MMTFDSLRHIDGQGINAGVPFAARLKTHDGKFADSSGAFLVGELERLDQTLNMPLVDYKYTRDIDLRTDVTIGDEQSSFILSQVASNGGLGTGNGIGNGKSWIGKNSNEIAGTSVDLAKKVQNLYLWGNELKYTIPELESAARTGRPIDRQKFEAMMLKYEMDCDEQAYIGDTALGVTGMLNNVAVTNTNNVLPGASGGTTWVSKTPDEILADVNAALVSVWTASAFAAIPNRILLPPVQFGYIAMAKVATAAGNMSIRRYIQENNLLVEQGAGNLTILPSKWLVGAGVGGTIGTAGTVDRMMVYTKDRRYIRFPKTGLDRTPVQFESIWHKTTYYGRLGIVEVPYPETVGYFDQI